MMHMISYLFHAGKIFYKRNLHLQYALILEINTCFTQQTYKHELDPYFLSFKYCLTCFIFKLVCSINNIYNAINT